MLEGKYTTETTFPPGDHRSHRPRSWLVNGVQKIETLRFLERRGRTLGQAAIQWLLAEPRVMTVLPNIYDREQLGEFAAAPDTPPLGVDELARDRGAAQDELRRRPGTGALQRDHVAGRGARMSGSRPIHTEGAPAPIGPYSQAIRAGKFLFCSGQIGLDPATGELAEGGIEAQTRQVMANIAALLAAAGLSFADVVKTTIFLADMNDFADVNEVYGEAFEGRPPPARSTVAVAGLRAPRGSR